MKIDPNVQQEIKVEKALTYLQRLGMKLKIVQPDQRANFEEKNQRLSIEEMDSNINSKNCSLQFQDLTKMALNDNNYFLTEDQDPIQAQSFIPHNTTGTRTTFLRKTSSLKQSLYFKFNKKSSKVETVEHLLTSSNQWAFDIKLDNLNTMETDEQFNSLINYQRKGLRTLAQNLNEISNQLEFKNPTNNRVADQKYSNKSKFLSQNLNQLQIQIKKCEYKQESLSDIQEIWTPNDLPAPKEMNYRSNRTYRKESHLHEEISNSCFSDAISSFSRKGMYDSINIKISENSIKGIYKNIRKLTEDLMQSDDNSANGQNSSSVSIEKISPLNSYDKKYKHGDENLSSYSTNGRSPNKTFLIYKTSNGQENDAQYTSNDSNYHQMLKPLPYTSKNNSSTDVNGYQFHSNQNNHQGYPHLYKNKSIRYPIRHAKHISQIGQISEYFGQNEINEDQNLNITSGGFDFETKDSFLNDTQVTFDNVENVKPQSCLYRKSTQDDSLKQPILGNISINQTNFVANARRK